MCFWCIKWPTLSCTHVLVRLARLADIRQTVYRGLARLADIRQTVYRVLARLADICRAVYRVLARLADNSPKAIFEKNVTRLDTFARVIRHSGEFGASDHCLDLLQNDIVTLTIIFEWRLRKMNSDAYAKWVVTLTIVFEWHLRKMSSDANNHLWTTLTIVYKRRLCKMSSDLQFWVKSLSEDRP